MTNTPVIRTATIQDVPSILSIEKAAGAAHWPETKYLEIFSDASSHRFLLVAEFGSKVQGFGVLRPFDQECEIENLVIAEEVRRRGCGYQLIQELIKLAIQKRAATIFLEVRESNLPARRLYNKAGFAESGRRNSYYRNPNEDAICYYLPL